MEIKVGGQWLNEVASWGDLSYSTRWPFGCYEASWGMYFPATARRNLLHAGQPVEIYDGSSRIWLGRLAQPDWSTGLFKADGWYTYADGPAINTSGDATARADHAVAGAIVRGIPWAGSEGAPSTPASTSATTDAPNEMSTIFEEVATEAGMRWGVFADGVVRFAADPVAPRWRVAPGVIDLGYVDTTFATRLEVRYFDSGTSDYDTVTVIDADAETVYAPHEDLLDLTGFGPLTTARATAKANGILTLGRSRPGWTGSVEVGPYELTTMGGNPGDLTLAEAGQAVRVPVWDDVLRRPYRDLVLGEVNRAAGSRTATIAPVDTESRTVADVAEESMRRARKKPFAA